MIRLFILTLSFLWSFQALADPPSGITPCVQSGSVPTTLSVSNSSANVQLAPGCPTVILMNITSQEAFLNLGTASSTAATTSGWSIPGNTFLVFNVPDKGTGYYLAAITSSSTTTIRIIQGTGY